MTDRELRSTKAGGDTQAKIGIGMGMALLLVWAVAAFYNGSPVWGIIASGLLVGSYFAGKNSSFIGPCPNCGAPMDELWEGRNARCSKCFLYSVRRGESLQELDREEHVQGKFDIPLALAGGLKSPGLCWKCGAATETMRTVAREINFSQNHLLASIRTYSVQVGDCGKHQDAPMIRFAAGGRSWDGLRRAGAILPEAKTSAHAALEVEDYRFYVEFLKVNALLLS
jgi:hypothetical protein